MSRITRVLMLGAFAISASHVAAQQKSSSDTPKTATAPEAKTEAAKPVVPLKVTVVFNEYDGERKTSSLPYTLFLKAAEEHRDYFGTIRMGVRVPIWTGKDQMQYQDVGSNIDCEARPAEDGRYILDLRLERSSLYSGTEQSNQITDEQKRQPMLRTFRANLALMLRDGQVTQSTVATDPLNGHTVRVDVTLNVLK
jgi:hypothetical protein